MLELTSFLGSKMMDVEDYIDIDDSDVIYYQQNNNEQLNLAQELLLPPIIYSNNAIKKDKLTLSINDTQSEYEKLNMCKWDISINIREILIENIFSKIKEARTFEGITSDLTKSKNIDQEIREYIKVNLVDRYNFDSLTLYLVYNSLDEDGNYQSVDDDISTSELIGSNVWDTSIRNISNIESKVEIDIDFDQTNLYGSFKQNMSRKEYNFSYYYDLKFKRA
jgi:hypothetical protein